MHHYKLPRFGCGKRLFKIKDLDFTHLFTPIVVSCDGNSLERLVPALGAKLFRHDGGDVEARVTPKVPCSRLLNEEAVEREDVETELFENVLRRQMTINRCHS